MSSSKDKTSFGFPSFSDWLPPPPALLSSSATKLKETSKSNDSSSEEFASPQVLLAKFKEIMDKVETESDSEIKKLDMTTSMTCMLALLKLSEKIDKFHPAYRNDLFTSSRKLGTDRDIPDTSSSEAPTKAEVDKAELTELVEVLEYADWAYMDDTLELRNKLKTTGYELFRHDNTSEPGRVGHYIAFDHQRKIFLIALKGTSSLADCLTDIVVLPKEHKGCHFDDDYFNSPKKGDIYCHEGMYQAASLVADDLQGIIEHLAAPQQYQILVCGHSLGAGTATLLGVLLRSRIPALRKKPEKNEQPQLRVIAYATPAVLSFEASKACTSFITSVVNNSDCVPRLSLESLAVLNRFILKVRDKLESEGRLPTGGPSAIKGFLDELIEDNDKLLMGLDELDKALVEAHAANHVKDDGLFVPGRIVTMWRQSKPDTEENDGKDDIVRAIGADCNVPVLRQVEFASSLVSDHYTASYRDSLARLLEEASTT